jgi:precorrin-6x reductase
LQALNEAMLKEFNIRVLVTKESGQAGGFWKSLRRRKTAACLRWCSVARQRERFTMAQIERALLDRFQTRG